MSLSGMRLRVLSALVLAIPALVIVYLGPPVFDLAFGAVGVLMALEWDRLCGGARRDAATWLLVATVAGITAVTLAVSHEAALLAAAAGFVIVLVSARGRRPSPLLAASGALYIGVPLVALFWLRGEPTHGLLTILWLLAIVWSTDTGALIVGRTIGGPKLAPTISPNKTWSGFFGGLAAAALVSAVTAALVKVPLLPVIGVGLLLSVVAQAGDLLESKVKRHLHVKDSGDLIPGHGGLFDRVDALLAAAPALALLYGMSDRGAFLWR